MRTRFVLLFATIMAVLLSSCKKDEEEQSKMPQPSFTYSGASMSAPADITFTNQSLNAKSYIWDFGDGTSSQEVNPVHSFKFSGTYSVMLTATNESGSTEVTQQIEIKDPLPVAEFSVLQDSLPAPATFIFQNSSQNATSYTWEFGDGETSISENPQHTYTLEGSYLVVLTATGSGGTNSYTKKLTVLDPANILPGTSAGGFQVNETWGSIKTKITSTTFWHTMLYIGGYYYHLCSFKDEGISFFFRTSSSSLGNSAMALVITVSDPFVGRTDKGVSIGSTVADVINAYGEVVEESYSTIYYDAIGIDFGYDEARMFVEDISVYEPYSKKSTSNGMSSVRSQLLYSRGTFESVGQ